MKEQVKLVLVLTVICLVAGLLLALTNGFTAEPIAKAERAERMAAIRTVLPDYDNEPDTDIYEVEDSGRIWTFAIARKDGAVVGTAFETVSSQGYGGEIRLMVGATADGKVKAIEILKQKETPGLGAKIQTPEFKSLFAGRDIRGTRWAVKKDRGDIDEITAATISSRAVTEAVKRGLDVYLENESKIGAP